MDGSKPTRSPMIPVVGFGPTMLAAPDGSSIAGPRQSATSNDSNAGIMFTRVQDLQRKLDEKEAANKALQEQLSTSQAETATAQKQVRESEERVVQRSAELKAAHAKEQELLAQVRGLQEQVAVLEQKAREEEEARAAELAVMGPPPPKPEEVVRDTLRSFDKAAALVCKELAEKAGVRVEGEAADGGAFVVGAEGLDADAMLQAGVSVDQAAEEYLRAAMERAVAAVEPARLEAVLKWRNELQKRRQLQDQLQELKGSIRVMCRVRPLTAAEGEGSVSTPSDTDVALVSGGSRKSFAFDHVFGSSSRQADVFEEVEPVIDSVLNGFNVCIFAYGQTGSGKTFTMDGRRDGDEANLGINPRALRRLFEVIAERKQLASLGGAAHDDGWSYHVAVSYLEIYNENLRDLLVAPSKPVKGKKGAESLDVKMAPAEDGKKGERVYVPGLTTKDVSSAKEVEATLEKGSSRRSLRATSCNSESSRSHSIVMVTVTGRHATSGASTHGKLHLIDLAGSERVKNSGVEGQGMKEASNINKSLSALGSVMAALQEKKGHIPYRDSKLTQLLADSLGGNSKTFMFVNVNPSATAAPETKCSLDFAVRVRRVELGQARGKRVEGASLQDVNAAKAAEERALTELSSVSGRLSEAEREAKLAREENRRLESELAAERKAASEYKETEEILKNSEGERQRMEIVEERKRVASLEARLKEANARAAHAEKQAAAAKTAAAEAERKAVLTPLSRTEDGTPAAGAASAQEAMNALEALRNSASMRLHAASGGSAASTPVGAKASGPAAPLSISKDMGLPPSLAPSAFDEWRSAVNSGPMDATPPPSSSMPSPLCAEPSSFTSMPTASSMVSRASQQTTRSLQGVGGLMDAPVTVDAPVLGATTLPAPLMPSVTTSLAPLMPCVVKPAEKSEAPPSASERVEMASASERVEMASASRPSTKRKSPTLVNMADAPQPDTSGSTPSKALPRYTPTKLPSSANKYARAAEGRKVKFQFEVQPNFEELDEDNAVDPEDSEAEYYRRSFAPQPAEQQKENALPRATTRAAATDKALAPVTQTVVSKEVPIEAQRAARPSLGLSLGRFGGASRVTHAASTKRAPSERQTLGATVKNAVQRAGAATRRMSLASTVAMEASNQRVRGKAVYNNN